MNNSNNNQTSYLRMSDIKKLIPVSSGTLYNWVKRGILTPIKITEGCTVYDRKEVEQLLSVKPEGAD
jgi:predicted DNA-binding transcriptional regulator AlpA